MMFVTTLLYKDVMRAGMGWNKLYFSITSQIQCKGPIFKPLHGDPSKRTLNFPILFLTVPEKIRTENNVGLVIQSFILNVKNEKRRRFLRSWNHGFRTRHFVVVDMVP